ncbi:hypothetical protein [Candidatus Contubernalis alkaliaceticus]|uniref:hypothetical protein n=1 Tax=Candidatus Contubernalis alkaliaceticus TaxID=338645 RepID=UPI001F4C37CE|nr:hypothetical protein [Candidatus Contubernalis alkalaceticus]UNC90816.1 hypothetical protein HUE98_01175 [Candidatus Contubernalis alkalaceticus]
MQISMFFSTKKIILVKRTTLKLVCLVVLLLTFLWFLKSFQEERISTHIKIEGLRDVQISSTEYPYFSYFLDKPYSTIFKEKLLFYKTTSPIIDMPHYDYYTYMFLYEDEQQVIIYYSPALNKIYNKNHMLEPSSYLKEVLLDLTALYRQEIYNTYGALIVWEEVDEIFPMYATAKITDIYTGGSFYVQRREGSSHVDAQPLTAEDTAIMKKIYDGQWSWERKGIIVEVRGYRIAASMNGMPHGSGKIDDNNFPGHFCIHFFGSTIHSDGMDIRHHREILKAAGKIPLKQGDRDLSGH